MKVFYYIATFIRSMPYFEGAVEDLKQHIKWYKTENLHILCYKTYKKALKYSKFSLWDDWTYDICKLYFNEENDCIMEYKELDGSLKYCNFKKEITLSMLEKA